MLGAGVLWQQQQPPVHCGPGAVGALHWQAGDLTSPQEGCSDSAGHGCTVLPPCTLSEHMVFFFFFGEKARRLRIGEIEFVNDCD